MSENSLVLVDLDESFLMEDSFTSLFENFTGSFVSKMEYVWVAVLYSLFGDFEVSYYVNKELVHFLNSMDFDREYILTARGFRDFKKHSMRLVEEYCDRFDRIILYPGKFLDGENVGGKSFSFSGYYLGKDTVEYKLEVAREFSNIYDIYIVDDSEELIKKASECDFIENQFLVKEGHVHSFDS